MKIVIATRNAHKLQEIKRILCTPHELVSLDAFPDAPEVEEDGETFEANACKKARELAAATNHWALGDDSGLCVTALSGEPGVYSARYAGLPTNDVANNQKLLKNLTYAADRSAKFVCVLALADPSGICRVVKGVCRGTIALQAAGAEGFGYDPLFIPTGYSCTFAQLDPLEKNRISHRGQALAAAAAAWPELHRETGGTPDC